MICCLSRERYTVSLLGSEIKNDYPSLLVTTDKLVWNDEILSVGPSQPDMIGLPTRVGL